MVQADPTWLSEGLEVKEAKLADKAYFSVKEFKDRLGVSSNLIYEQLRKGALPSVRLGRENLDPRRCSPADDGETTPAGNSSGGRLT